MSCCIKLYIRTKQNIAADHNRCNVKENTSGVGVKRITDRDVEAIVAVKRRFDVRVPSAFSEEFSQQVFFQRIKRHGRKGRVRYAAGPF